MCTDKPLALVDRGPWYRWAFERLGLEYRHEEQGREVLQIPKGEDNSIPPQDKRERPHTGNKQPILQYTTRHPGGEVGKNAYLEIIKGLSQKH